MDVIPRTNIVFIHIPKTAGLSIRKAFRIKTNGSHHSLNTPQDLEYLTGDYIRFCVVRNPLERFVSAYKYHSMQSQRQPTSFRKQFEENPELRTDINSFVDFLRANFENPAKASIHFARQSRFIRHGRPHIILRQENLSSDIQIIAKLAAKRFNGLPKQNVSDSRFDTSSINTDLKPDQKQYLTRLLCP